MSEHNSGTDQRQFWQMVIETWQASGLPVRQFCRQEGLSEPSFYSWRRKLTKDAGPGEYAAKERVSKTPVSAGFIEVSLPEPATCGLEIALTSGNILRIGSAVDSKTLSGVISALHEAGLC